MTGLPSSLIVTLIVLPGFKPSGTVPVFDRVGHIVPARLIQRVAGKERGRLFRCNVLS